MVASLTHSLTLAALLAFPLGVMAAEVKPGDEIEVPEGYVDIRGLRVTYGDFIEAFFKEVYPTEWLANIGTLVVKNDSDTVMECTFEGHNVCSLPTSPGHEEQKELLDHLRRTPVRVSFKPSAVDSSCGNFEKAISFNPAILDAKYGEGFSKKILTEMAKRLQR